MGAVPVLDKGKSYGYQDKSETFWKFHYDKIGDVEGWWIFVTRPGDQMLCVGRTTEEEILQTLKGVPPPLTQDDLIDLELWLEHNGLEEFKKVKKTRKRKEI